MVDVVHAEHRGLERGVVKHIAIDEADGRILPEVPVRSPTGKSDDPISLLDEALDEVRAGEAVRPGNEAEHLRAPPTPKAPQAGNYVRRVPRQPPQLGRAQRRIVIYWDFDYLQALSLSGNHGLGLHHPMFFGHERQYLLPELRAESPEAGEMLLKAGMEGKPYQFVETAGYDTPDRGTRLEAVLAISDHHVILALDYAVNQPHGLRRGHGEIVVQSDVDVVTRHLENRIPDRKAVALHHRNLKIEAAILNPLVGLILDGERELLVASAGNYQKDPHRNSSP